MKSKNKKILIVLASFLLGINASANETVTSVTLDEAVGIALMNHPRLKMASADIERIKAARGEVWDGGSTTVGYAWGQLNGEFKKDNELSVEQSLGSFLTPFYRNALVGSQLSTGESYRSMVRKEIVAEVKRAWVYYQYTKSVYHLYSTQEDIAKKLYESAQFRFQQGDIDMVEKNMISAMAANLHALSLQWSEELALAEKRFTWVCYSEKKIQPVDETDDTPQLLKTMQEVNLESVLPSLAHLDYFSGRVDEKKNMLKIERSKFFPEFSVGYSRQKIMPLKNLNSWMVSVSFPVLFFPQHSRSKQAKIELQKAEWEETDSRKQLSNKIEELKTKIRQQNESLEFYKKAALDEADALQNSTLLKFDESEIGITEFVQSLNSVRDIRKMYLETIYNYNVSVLELELYTE